MCYSYCPLMNGGVEAPKRMDMYNKHILQPVYSGSGSKDSGTLLVTVLIPSRSHYGAYD